MHAFGQENRTSILPSLFIVTLALTGFAAADSRAATVLPSVTWAQVAPTPGTLLSGSWDYGSVSGTTTAMANSGAVFGQNWGSLPFSAGYSTSVSSNNSTVLGSVNGTTKTQTISFSSVVTSPYLFFNYTDPGTSFDFGAYNWSLLGATYAERFESSVFVAGFADNSDVDGFLVRIDQTFGPGTNLVFNYVDDSVTFGDGGNTVGFTIGQTAALPEPSTYCMALAGLACGGFSMWRRRKRA